MNKKISTVVSLLFCIFGVSAWAECQQPDRTGNAINLRSGRTINVVEQVVIDKISQSTLRQKLLLLGDNSQIKQEDARIILMEMFDRAKAACRSYSLSGVMIFLYGSKDAVTGTNWLARLNTLNGMTPSIDVNPGIFPETASLSMCDSPNAPKPKGKEDRSPDEVMLPPLIQRKVLGTWSLDRACTRSFEEVKGRVYQVIRCSDCSGGNTGTPLVKGTGNTFTQLKRRNGEYFKILPNGYLASYDREGMIDNYPQLSRLWP